MKKFSLLTILALSTMLTACGGGGGSGHVPVTTLPTIPETPGGGSSGGGSSDTSITNPEKISMESNAKITGMSTRQFSDESAFTDYVIETIGEDVYAGVSSSFAMFSLFSTDDEDALGAKSSNNMCKSIHDCNQEIFDNIIKVLVEQDLVDAKLPQIKQALLLAGFSQQDLAGHIDDIKAAQKWIKDHPNEIQQKLDKLFGLYANLTLDNATMNLVESSDKQDTFVKFTVDKNNKINGIKVLNDTTSPGGGEEFFVARQGDTNVFKDVDPDTIRHYGIVFDGWVASVEGPTTLTIDDIKERLFDKYDDLTSDQKAAINALTSLEDFENRDPYKTQSKLGAFYIDYISEATSTYQSYGKTLGLSYSDFGVLKIDDKQTNTITNKTENIVESNVIAGGYEDKRIDKAIDKNDLDIEMDFVGKAVGAVNLKDELNQGNDEDVKSGVLALNGNATLKFNNGAETLTANFDNWYDVTVKSNAANNYDITFENGTKPNFGNGFEGEDGLSIADLKFAKDVDGTHTVTNMVGESNRVGYDDYNIITGSVDIGYYGEDIENIKEATGFVYYSEPHRYDSNNDGTQDRVKELNAQFSFGAKAQ